MATSEARIQANRRNALLSTGPKTQEGKDRSRANALKHGLCSTTLVPEDLRLVTERAMEWYMCLKPQNPYQTWMINEIAVISLRIDRAERMERRLRDRAMLRAELTWDEDRMIEVESLGSKLSRRPSEIVRQLRATPQGCDWLIERWSILARAADQNSSWTSDQTRLAFDLLGTTAEARDGRAPGDLVNLDGTLIEPSIGPLNVARREVDQLLERRSVVADLDEVDRSLVAADQYDETNAEHKRLRRHENTLHNRLRWFINQMHDPSPHVLKTHADLKPNWVERVEPPAPSETVEPKTEPPALVEIHPPFDLTPDEFPEPGELPDIPKIIANRRDKKLRKAEARRDAKRRRVERLRA
jgi:hypothetical protein